MRKILIYIFAVRMAFGVSNANAQTECFIYDDEEETIVSGINFEAALTEINNQGSLTIPSSVVKVSPYAFSLYGSTLQLEKLIIEGNPEFELDEDEGKNALAYLNQHLSVIEIQGTAMTAANIGKMLEGCGNTGTLEKIDIYNDKFPLDAVITSDAICANTNNMKVVLPAARVGTQQFGYATVYGRFMLTSEIVSFCGNACFQDIDDGSNLLFYIPTEIVEHEGEKKVHIERVHYIMPNQGVLRHKKENSSSYVELPRVGTDDVNDNQYNIDDALFDSNLLVGVTSPTLIGATETIGGEVYTNMILNSGAFYRTSGGTLGANRAYLRVRSSDVADLAKLSTLADDEPTGINTMHNEECIMHNNPSGNSWYYDLQGRKISFPSGGGREGASSFIPHPSSKKGIYIIDGKKVVIGH